jgi:hypothetical protein
MSTDERVLFARIALGNAISRMSEDTEIPVVRLQRISHNPMDFMRILKATLTFRQSPNFNRPAHTHVRLHHAIERLKRIPMVASIRVTGFDTMQVLMKYIIACYDAGNYNIPDAEVDYASRYISYWANKFIRGRWTSEYAALNYYATMAYIWSFIVGSEHTAEDVFRIAMTGLNVRNTGGRIAALAA